VRGFWYRFGVPLVIVLVIWSLTTHGKFSNSGDEPHYLMIAESLVADRDLDLENNYGRASGRWFGLDEFEGGPHVRRNVDGKMWSGHDIGLPVLILPVYAAATRLSAHVPEATLARFRQTRGLFAYSLVSLSLIILTAWAASLLLSALRRQTTERIAVVVVLALVLSPPVMGHAFLVFPETPAFAVVCLAIWLVSRRSDELRLTKVIAVCLAVGAMPWLHRKYSFLSLGLLWLIAQQHWTWLRAKGSGVLVAIAAAGIVPHAALHLWTIREWGTIGGGFMTEGAPFSAAGIQRGALGMLFDRERGLVSYAPIFLIVPACWAFTWRTTWRAAVPILLLYLPMAAFVVWGAGFSPPARYIMPILPLLAFAAARGLEQPIVRRAAIPLLVFQVAITAYCWQHPRAMWPQEVGTNQALDAIPLIGPLYARALPSLLTGDAVVWGWMVLGTLAVMTVTLLMIERRRGQPAPRTFCG
jgi:hypothetical protein